MKNSCLIYLSLLFTLPLFLSCSVHKIAIQIADPPKFQIPQEIKSIAIFNRSLGANFTEMPVDDPKDLNETLAKSKFYDISAADSVIVSAARALFASQRYDVVVPFEWKIRREENTGMLLPLDSTEIREICQEFNVDAVLVLEDFSQRAQFLFTIQWIRCMGNIALATDAIWRLYLPGKPPLHIPTREKLYWFGGLDDSRREGVRQLPPLKNMLITGGMVTGEIIANQIGPKWEDQSRSYYRTGKKKIDAAISLIHADKWEDAFAIWSQYASVPRASLRHKIEYNLALASEMSGDPEKAIEWCNKSFQTMPSKKARSYSTFLINREKRLAKISSTVP